MGHGMAANIRARGYKMTVMAHVRREAVDDLVARGADEAATAADLGARSDIVLLCVPGAAEVDALVRGGRGLVAGVKAGCIVVDCTTSDPSTLLKLAADYAGQRIDFADAPLGRSPKEAWQGTLSTACAPSIAKRSPTAMVMRCCRSLPDRSRRGTDWRSLRRELRAKSGWEADFQASASVVSLVRPWCPWRLNTNGTKGTKRRGLAGSSGRRRAQVRSGL